MNTREKFEFDLISLGILVFDVFGKSINEFPEKGTSLFFDTLQTHPGGCAYNTGVDSARLGLRVAVFGKLGNDSFGDIIAQNLQNEGVDIAGVKRVCNANTAFSFIMVPDDGQRRIYTSFGANCSYCPEDIHRERILKSRILHVAGASLLPRLDGEPAEELLKFAQDNGVLTSMDTIVKRGIGDIIIPCLKYLDIFIPNNDESYYITGYKEPEKQLRFYVESGVRLAGIKMGHRGCMVSDGKTIYKIGVYDVPVVDTCGAGDAFIAGFLYGTIQGWDLLKAAQFATTTSNISVGAIGATTAVPDAGTVLDFMKNNRLNYEESIY